MDKPKISVIIPVKNEEEKIGRCLDAIFNQTLEPFEVIVVDGHSNDNTVENVRKLPVKIIYESYGTVGGARQIGLENAVGEFIAFTDADCVPEKYWLENLINDFKENIVGIGGGTKNIGEGLWEKSIGMALDSFLGSANSVQDRVLKEKRFVKSISGCNSMYRRDDLIKIGGFDTKLSMNEDTEINKRLLKFGKLLYTPNAIILHNQKRDLKGFIKRMYFFGYGRGSNRLWDLQVIPPIVIILSMVSLIFTLLPFLIMTGIYIIILIVMGMKFVVEKRDFKYMASVPIVYIAEHISYTIGFWRGIVKIK